MLGQTLAGQAARRQRQEHGGVGLKIHADARSLVLPTALLLDLLAGEPRLYPGTESSVE